MVERKPGRGNRKAYARFVPIATRWMDNDAYGHVNNVVYYSFFDTAVNAMLIQQGLLAPDSSAVIALVAETGCRYHESVTFPEMIEVGVRVARLGSSSIRYELAVFGQGKDLAAADGHFIHVCVDAQSRRPTPIPAGQRAFLESLIVESNV